jgi:RNA polymerase-binding transcription factor DksA
MTDPPTPEQIQRLRRQLLRKGSELAEKLAELMAGKEIRMEEILRTKPGETPIERLRRFMALIDGRLAAIRAGTYGRCEQCGDGLPYAHLEQIPWIDTCQACAAPREDRQ